ncbi:hypothetical protein ANTRET_LOCUS4064 [Anthophora retusa]
MSAAYASRFEAVFLCKHPKGPKMSHAAVAKYIGKSKTFVKKWVVRYESTKTVDLPDGGVKRKFSEKDDKRILTIFSKNPGLLLRQGQMKLEEKGLNISLDTIQRHLQAHDVKWRSAIKKPPLTEKHAKARFAWAKENINRNWNKVIFSDELTFYFSFTAYIYPIPSQRKIYISFNNYKLSISIELNIFLYVGIAYFCQTYHCSTNFNYCIPQIHCNLRNINKSSYTLKCQITLSNRDMSTILLHSTHYK